MTANHSNFPGRLTFSQRCGYEPLPEPMQLEQISPDLRREIWNLIYRNPDQYLVSGSGGFFAQQGFYKLIEVVLGKFKKIPESRIQTDSKSIKEFEQIILDGEFNRLLDFLEILIDEQTSNELALGIRKLFKDHSAAYWLDMLHIPYRFIPCVSEEQRDSTQRALEMIQQAGMIGARSHLHEAGVAMKNRQYADSVRESIHAVESVARKINPKSKTLGDALKSLEQAGVLKHPALPQAFRTLYGYTNDEQGIRHALLDKNSADVGLDEAMFMFGACASFAAYLTQKHRQAGGT